ncbi:MAG: LPXTG cell wall anchor domain-containing protein [Ruminococcus sp.]|nr:LPXTG cell wall anchor domain-containing protein [Ruminococcus sp.]
MRSRSSYKRILSKAVVYLLSIAMLLANVPLEAMLAEAAASAPEISAAADTLEYQSISAYPGEDHTEKVALDGMMPAESDLVVNRTGDTVSNETLCAYDISILNNGKEFQPNSANPITVSITNNAIGEARAADRSIGLWHIGGDGSVTEIKDFDVRGNTICFSASGFSVYIVSSDGEPPLCTYKFYMLDQNGTPQKYYFSSSNGEKIWRQTVQNGEKLSIPQLPSIAESSTSTFMGWYVYENGALSSEPLDFDALPPVTETKTVQLRAVFAQCAYVIFHEQFNGTNNSWPIAATRRGELSGGRTNIKIDDVTVTYDDSSAEGEEQQNKSPQMIFRGWSKKKVTEPGRTTDDNGDPIVLEPDTISISSNTDLYPVFSNIRWLTLVSGQTGTGATYVPPKYYYVDEGADDLPGKDTVKRTGYVFDGWFTAEEGGTRITDENGNIVAPVGTIAGTDLEITEENGHKKLIVKEDTTIYGRWLESDASYTVVIWRQKADVDAEANGPEDYDYAESFTVNSTTGSVISQPAAEYRNKAGTTGYEGFHYSHCDTNVTVKGDGTSVLNVYYNRNIHTFTFRYGGSTVKTITEIYGANLVKYFPIIGNDGRSYNGYQWTASNTQVYNYAMATIEQMPDANVIFDGSKRGTSKTIYYYAEINPDLPYMYTGTTRTFNGKTYELYKTVNHNFNYLTYNEEFHPIEGYIRSPSNAQPAFGNNNQASLGSRGINYLYYDRDESKIEFRNSIDATGASSDTLIENKMVKYSERVSDYLIDPPAPPTGYQFKGWYADAACKIKIFFSEPSYDDIHYIDENGIEKEIQYQVFDRMPAHNIKLYAGWEPKWYRIEIDPNGGVLGDGQSTWFWKKYQSDEVHEYSTVTRNYIEDPKGTYFYHVLDRAAYGLGDDWEAREDSIDDRSTYYSSDLDNAVNYTRYKYMPGAYRYAGWYEVDPVTGEETLFKFGTLVTGDLKLKLHWKQVGTYYINYDPHEGDLDNNDNNEDTFRTLDDSDYADHSSIVVSRTAIAPAGYNFIGWTIRNDPSGRVYYPGQAFEFNSVYTNEVIDTNGNKKYTIFLDAVYRKIETASIIYDANGGEIDTDTVDHGESLLDLDPEDMQPKTSCDGSQAIISSLYDNSPIRLSSGAGFSYGDYVFCGWNTEPDGSGRSFDPDAISADPALQPYVDSEEPVTLYAMWKIKVYFDKNKDAAVWGSGWNSPKYKYDNAKKQYYTEILLNSKLEAPEGVPYIADPDQLEQGEANTFRYWSLGRYTDNESNAPPYDFGQPVTGEMTLYVWTGELEVPIHAVDASESELSIRDSDWLREGKEVAAIGNEEVSFQSRADADVYVDAHDGNDRNYSYAFACVCDKNAAPEDITDDKKIDHLYYNVAEMSVWVHYSNGNEKPLKEDEEVYLIYYRDPETVPIGYKDMASSGALTDTANVSDQAPVEAEIYQTTYIMSDDVTKPLTWANKDAGTYYSFAIGDPNATDASKLHFITQASNSDGSLPDLQVKNTWRGYKYSLDGGENWNDAGYDIQLYVVYYPSQPTILTLDEKTIGLPEDMDREFTYSVKITEKTITKTVRQYYTNSNFDTYADSDEISITEGPERIILDSDLYCSLSDGTSESITLFNSENRVKGAEQQSGSFWNRRYYTDDVITTTTQTITIVQEFDPKYDTEVSEDNGSHSGLTYTYTTDGVVKEVEVTYTNSREPYLKELHTAIAQSGVFTAADNIRTSDDSVYAKGMDLEETWDLTEISAADMLTADARGKYVFAGIIAGKPDENGNIELNYDGIEKLCYNVTDPTVDNIYDFFLDDDVEKLLEDNEIYFLYFRKPEIVYVKEAADGTLTQIEEPFYRGGTALETLNGRPLTQNAMLDVTAGSDLVISNGTGNGLYRVPPDLDGKSQNSLEYVKIGAGAAGAENSSQLDMVSGDLELRLGVNDHQIMYRLTADGEWQVFSGDPTVYIIYHEEEPMPAPTGVNDNTAPYLMITAVILIAGAILLLIRKRKEGMENETDPL